MLKAKKILSVILTLCIVASLIAGCTTTPAEVSGTPSTAGEPGSAEAPKDPVTLNFWMVGNAQDQHDRVETAVNAYLKDTLGSHIQVNIEELGWDDAYNTKANNALSTGQEVDIMFTSSWAANIAMNAGEGYFLPLNDYIAQYPEVTQILGDDFIKGTQINGVNYAMPCNKEKFHNWGYLLRKDLVEKYNVDLTKIKSTKDLEPIFDQILANEPGITPIGMSSMDVPEWKFLDWDGVSDDDLPGAFYPSTDNSKTTIINQWTAPETVAVYKQMKEYLKKGYISADAATAPSVTELLGTGKYFAAVQSLKPDKDKEMSMSTGVDYVQVDITQPYKTNRETLGGALLAIPQQSKHPEDAFEFISLLYTDANLINLIVYGQKDVDYTLNANGTVTPIEGSGYASGNGWRFGDQFKDYLLDTESTDKWDRFIALNNAAPALYSHGFLFDVKKDPAKEEELKTIIANCKAVTQEYYKTLLSGQAPDVDKMVAEMDAKYKAAGVDKLLAEMQAQFDEWAAANK